MDIDRFFSVGPATRFQANDIFTNREKYVAEFHHRALHHVTQQWGVDALMDFRRPARNLLVIVGDGGLGKSALSRRMASLAVGGSLHGVPSNSAVATIDFADMETRSAEIVLLRVRAAFANLARSFPAFDMGLAAYWGRKHPGESLSAFVRRSSKLGSAATSLRVADQMLTAIDTIASGGLGIVGLGRYAVTTAGQAASRARAVRTLRRDLPAFDALLQTPDPDRMLGYLPILLSYDIERKRSKTPTLPICILDTLENIQVHPAEQNGAEDLLCRLVYMMPNVLFIGASRRPLMWHDPIYSAALTYNGSHRWPGLAGAPEADQFALEALESRYADAYLRGRLTVDGEPAISQPFRDRIVAGSSGSPLYLQLSVDLFDETCARGESPELAVFGRPLPQLVTRIMRDLDATDRDLLRAAALFRAFDEDMLRTAVSSARGVEIEEFCGRSFVRRDHGVWPPYRLHDNLRACVTACDRHTSDAWTDGERRTAVLQIALSLELSTRRIWEVNVSEVGLQADLNRKAVASFLLTLYAALEHQVRIPALAYMAHALYELGHRQVLATLPDPEHWAPDELARLVEVARISASAEVDVRPLYDRLRAIVADSSVDAYAVLAKLQLGLLSFMSGDLVLAADQFRPLTDEPEPIGSSAVLGLAGCAQRLSRFGEHASLAARLSSSRLDRTRQADTLGHLYMHNGLFSRAAESFEEAHEYARSVGAPLWISRAARHLALATMWLEPDRAASVVVEARLLNEDLMDVTGLGQCDMASAMVNAHRGKWADAQVDLEDAARRFQERGLTFELLPTQAIQVLIAVAAGKHDEARAIGEALALATNSPKPLGPPVWAAVVSLWLSEEDWFDFDSLDWLEPYAARDRWMMPLHALCPGS